MFKRIAFFIYGSLSYLIFLGTFLYAIGFIGNFGVPTTLDGAPSGPLGIAFAIDVGLLASLRGAAQRHGAQVVQGLVDSHRAEATRTIHLRPVFESRSDSVVLAVATVGRCRVVHRRSVRHGSSCVVCSHSAGGWCWSPHS